MGLLRGGYQAATPLDWQAVRKTGRKFKHRITFSSGGQPATWQAAPSGLRQRVRGNGLAGRWKRTSFDTQDAGPGVKA
jgi:hypothetical protein